MKSHRLSVNFPFPSSMRLGNSEVLFVSSVENLGVTLDCNLNMTPHVLNIYRSAYSAPQWGAADAEIKVPSGENTELKRSPFKAWSKSVCSHTCYAYCQGFLS